MGLSHESQPSLSTHEQCGLGWPCPLLIWKLRGLDRTISKDPSSSQIPGFHDLTHRTATQSQADSEICSSLEFHNLD